MKVHLYVEAIYVDTVMWAGTQDRKETSYPEEE